MQLYSDFDNYKWIDCNRWSDAKEVDAQVAYLTEGITSRKKSGYLTNMKVIVMNLYHSHLTDNEQYIAYNRGKDHYLNTGENHPYIKNPHITHTNIVGCIKQLRTLGMIEHHKGGYFYNEELGDLFSYVSRMRAKTDLVELWSQYNITPEMITTFAPEELIRMKGPKEPKVYTYKGKVKTKMIKPPMKCPDTPVVRRMSKVIIQYNNLLDRTNIDVDVECMTINDRDELKERLTDMDIADMKILLRLADKSVYRVFNNGSLEQGGRFYGAWWTGAPGIVRKYITINGKPTRELDYSGIHIHLLYAIKGINYADMKDDPYKLDDGAPDRDLNKLILLTAFNAESPADTAAAVFDELRNQGRLKRYKLDSHDPIYTKLDLLKAKHPEIAGMIANNYGATLQYYDSCVIEKLIEHFTKENVPILTIHDSVICQAEHSEFIKDKMWSLYADTIGKKLKCKIEYKSINPHASKVMRSFFKQRKYQYNMNVIRSVFNRNRAMFNYTGKVPPIDNSIIAIKTDQRTNTCSGMCHHAKRVTTKLTQYKTIKITLEQNQESYTNILVIR